jgi:hypothetical protein
LHRTLQKSVSFYRRLAATKAVRMVARAIHFARGDRPLPETAAIITVLIVERPLCVDCIAEEANLSTADTERYLETICKTVNVRVDDGRCRKCGNVRRIQSVAQMAIAFRHRKRRLW